MPETPCLEGQSILCFAPDPWGDLWRNRHRLLGVFAASNRVLYVEPRMGIRQLLRKIRTGEIRARDFVRPRLSSPVPGIHVYHDPIYLPRIARGGVGALIERRRDRLLRRAMRALGLERPILWLVRPDQGDLPGRFDEQALLYQIVDDYASYPGITESSRRRIESQEAALAARADLVVVTAERLLERKGHLCPRTILVPNGVDARTIEEGLRVDGPLPADLAGLSRPLFGYIGGITEKLDLALLERIAGRLESAGRGTLVLVGSRNITSSEGNAALERILRSPRVHFAGKRDSALVPSYLRGFQVGLVPYRVGEQARAIDPLKLYEYLAFGLPVVSVDIPSVRRFSSVVRIARNPDEFLSSLEPSAAEDDADLRARRRALARENSWEVRADSIGRALVEVLRAKSEAVLSTSRSANRSAKP